MKTTRFLSVILLLCICTLGVNAQRANQLTIEDIAVEPGTSADLPIIISNTDAVVGMEFDITLPSGITMDERATPTDRIDGHQTTVKKMGEDTYKVMLYSPSNKPILGNNGTVFMLHLHIPDHLEEGTEHPISIQHAVLGKATGENVLTRVLAGKIRIPFFPDLIPKNIKADKTTINPGDHITVSWTVENLGELATGDGWSEQISLVADDGSGSKLIGTTYFYQSLAGKSLVNRSTEIDIPKLVGLDGSVKLQVRIIPFDTTKERENAKENNIQLGSAGYTINKELTLEISPIRFIENDVKNLYVKLTRSGRWTEEQSFDVTATSDSRVTIPAKISVPEGQSGVVIYLPVVDNTVLDNDSIVDISIAGYGYAAVTQRVIIEDNEFPDLIVTTSKSEVNEGDKFQLTITTSRVSSRPIEVTVLSEDSKRFSFPATVTIPAGEESVNVTIETTDDDVPSLNLSNIFTVSAPDHNKAEVIVMLMDDDLPVLELSLSPSMVSEDAGVTAVTGTLRRTVNLDKKITVKLTDDAEGGLYFGNRTIEMSKGVDEVYFNFGPVDNTMVDGDRTYNITAAVWISSCNCGASGESAGHTTAQLKILDNDGAALGLSSSVNMLKEGSSTTLTISRNTNTSSPLTVTLNCDYDEGLTYPQSVTIPAGKKSTEVEVASVTNDVQGDSHNVIFTVLANGFATGTCYLTVTDQTKPDAVISSIIADNYEIEVGQSITLSITVENKGIASLLSPTEVLVRCNGSSVQKTIYTSTDIAVGESVVLMTDYQLPFTKTGTYTLTATVNPDKSVPELNYSNNSVSSSAITLLPNYSATVTVDQKVYKQGETVTISGQTSSGGYGADVEVYLVNNGTRNSIILKADSEGRFQTTFKPYDRQSGHFVIGACYPNTGETSGSAEFDVYGLLLPNSYATHDISLGSEATGKIVIKNPGLLSQSGLQIEELNESVGCELTIGNVSSITADGQVEVSYKLKAKEVSQGNDWLQVPLRITSSEGSNATFTIYYFVHPLKGQLKASQTFIETTVTKDVPRDYQFQVSNVGLGETGRISLSLPSWIELNASSEIPSLNQGDTVTIALRMVPTDQMQLNVPISGQIGINCEKGDGVAVGLRVTPVSEEKGNLIIDVVDEYTYYAEGSPHVESARILVKHPTTGQVIAQGLTTSDGLYSVELPEGWYSVSINADKHQSYQTTLEIAPGRNTAKEVFLTYEAITYSWEVVETEVEDEYEIETVVKYETNVPKPVIISTLPKEKPKVGSVIPVVVTNKGLIAANNVNLALSASGGFSLEWLTEPSMAVLAPQQTVTFYAVLKQNETHQAPKKAPGETYGTCMSLYLKIRGHYFCGEYEEAIEEMNSRAWGDCLESHFYTNGGSSSGSGGSGGSGSWGGGTGGGGGYPSSGPGGSSNGSYGGSSWGGSVSPTAKMCHEKEVVLLTDLAKVAEPQKGSCGETHIGGYILIPDSGPEYKVEGVAADGESKVRIVFSGEEGVKNVIPFDDSCGKPHWTIKEGFGTLENADSWYNVVYKAPADYPGDGASSSCTVNAVLEYPRYSISPNGELIMHNETFEVPIKITRAPLALIHGLFSTGNRCWSGFGNFITGKTGAIDMYEDYQVMYVDYSDTHTAWFSKNEKVVQKAIDQLKARFISNGIVATKADLIGHSMGGILARLHAQYINNTNIHKLITVNTPHSGSPIANVMNSLSWEYRQLLFLGLLADKVVYGSEKISDGAIKDLAIGSEGTDDYLNDNYNSGSQYLNRLNGIPVHAVASYLEGPSLDVYYGLVASMGVLKQVDDAIHGVDIGDVENVMDGILSEPHPENLKNSLKKSFKFIKSLSNIVNGAKDNAALIELPETFNYGVNLAEALSLSDCVVPYDSQTGGLDPKYVKPFNGGFEVNHLSITENDEVWKHLKNLLYASVNDDRYFSKTGFHPNKLDFSTEGKQEEKEPNHAPRRIVNEYSMNISLDIVGDSLHVRVTGPDAPAILVKFSDDYDVATESEFNVFIPSTHVGDIKVYACHENTNGEIYLDSAFVNIPTSRIAPIKVECQDICQIVVSEPMRASLICTWEDGSQTTVIPDNVTFTDNLANYANGMIHGIKRGSGTATFTYQNLTCDAPITVYNFGESIDEDENSKSVCSTVTLKLSQTMVMTRQAFRGTLTLFNGNEHASMRDVKLTLQVTNKETGAVATSHEFQINPESIDGFTGEISLTSGWTLAGNATGTANVLFIPTKYAAPTEPVEWSFGGTLSYTDPFTGLVVTRDLYPVTLTVKPSPELDLDYFLQRDVYGDDPLTEEVEQMLPAEFALLINNKGFGDATNVRMTTQQPQIIDNEKGLLINFEILSSQMNGNEAYLALGQSIANDFGTIGTGTQAYAQWWLQSSLLGHFTEYSVSANHVTSYGNEDLSLLDNVRIHELIHGYTVNRDDRQPMRGFLVNDIKDAEDLPDRIYFTDATQKEVTVNNNATIVKQSDTEYLLTVSGSSAGWNYGSLLDPTQGKQTLASIVRQSDGESIPVDNIWQTDRTLRDGNDWLYENRLHYIGEMSASGDSYLLTFEPRPEEFLSVEGYEGLPDEGEVASVPVEVVTVKFNKAVAEGTFTTDDITLTCQGKSLDTSKMTIIKVSDTDYEIDLSALTSEDGFYVLTVQTANIADSEGFAGESGKQAMWTQSGFLLGDVNYDRRINGMDIVELVELIMGSRFDRAGDLYPSGNPDGVLTGMDLVEEVELVMSQTAGNHAPALTVRIERMAMKSERSGVKSLGIQSDRPFILAQMTVELSDGMMLSSITSDRRHNVAYRQTADNKYVVVCYSNRNESFEANGKALEFHCVGEGGIRVSDVLLIDADKQECLGTDAQSGDVTGIQETKDERLKMNDSDIYDLSGRKIESSKFKAQSSKLQKGVYIINKRKVTIK